MATWVSRLASSVSQRFLSADYEEVLETLRWLRDGGPTYSIRENSVLARAVLAAEDRSFYTHSGFHIRGILRAGYVYITSRRLQEASTIEQQLVRVVRRRYELTLARKASEILLATSIGREFAKDAILEMYMEVAYFGWRGTGIKHICNRLDIEVNSMNSSEACLVASLIKLPLPRKPSESYLKKQRARSEYIMRVLAEDRRAR